MRLDLKQKKGAVLAISYDKLFSLLNTRHILLQSLCKKLSLGLYTEKKFRKNKSVSLEVLEKVCIVLDCKIEDVVEFVPDNVEPKIDV